MIPTSLTTSEDLFRRDTNRKVPANIMRTIGSVFWVRLFEVKEVDVANIVTGNNQFESI